VLNNAASINGDPKRVAVGGESAGGNLAAVVSMMARDKGVKLPVHQLLVYPITSFNFESPSYTENANAHPLSKGAMQWFLDKYMRSAADAQNPYLIPINGNLKGLPPATIINAQIDPLRWDGEEYARRLQAAGVPVLQHTYPGVTHEFFGMGAVVPEAKDAVNMAATALKRAYGTQ
jgi:acetyl esterase